MFNWVKRLFGCGKSTFEMAWDARNRGYDYAIQELSAGSTADTLREECPEAACGMSYRHGVLDAIEDWEHHTAVQEVVAATKVDGEPEA